jgi:murein DD-endopeptidase MepM/ murein hydrolase activator NlpD
VAPSDTDRRGWFSRGFTALAISALGLAVAGSVALSSSAEPTLSEGNAPAVLTPSDLTPSVSPSASPSTPTAVEVFTPETPASADPSPHDGVVDSQAAQRAEELAKAAEQLSRAAKAATDEARKRKLSAADRASQETAAKLAEEALQKAVAARLAAEQSRKAAEQAATTDPTTTDPTTIPTGGAAVSPVPGAVSGAHFGDVGIWARYHTGLDFRAAAGTPIRAVKAGVVLYAGNSGNWAGNHVAVKHADGMTTMYCHMSSMAAHAGETVQAGQIIGYVGETGRAFGPHLHFELYPPGVKYGDIYHAINPQPYLNANGVQTH